MTPDLLLSEGRRLAKRCLFLREHGDGSPVATWHPYNSQDVDQSGFRRWITIESCSIPGLSPPSTEPFLSVLTDDHCGGRVELLNRPPKEPGIPLYAEEEQVIAPIEAVFYHGSDKIQKWLAANNWSRNERYSGGFPDSEIVDDYLAEWMDAYPLYQGDEVYAALGGWHFPCADDDWYQFVDERMCVLTIAESEPWVEAWQLRSGEFKVIPRTT